MVRNQSTSGTKGKAQFHLADTWMEMVTEVYSLGNSRNTAGENGLRNSHQAFLQVELEE